LLTRSALLLARIQCVYECIAKIEDGLGARPLESAPKDSEETRNEMGTMFTNNPFVAVSDFLTMQGYLTPGRSGIATGG
jgi:hypothetical protein